MRWLGLIFTIFVFGGCSATNLASVLEAAGKDPATVCGNAMYAGAALNFARTNITNGEVDCNNGHLTVHSTPPPLPVGIQLVPR